MESQSVFQAETQPKNVSFESPPRYGPRSQWAEEKVEEEARLAKRGALASARLQRRFSKLPRVIPKARRVLDFDREDGGDRVPTGSWSQLSRHELKRIFPSVYDKDKTTAEVCRTAAEMNGTRTGRRSPGGI